MVLCSVERGGQPVAIDHACQSRNSGGKEGDELLEWDAKLLRPMSISGTLVDMNGTSIDMNGGSLTGNGSKYTTSSEHL